MTKKEIPRQPRRFPVDVEAKFRVVGTVDWQAGNLLNLSSGGLCLETNAWLEANQVIEMIIETTDNAEQKRRRRILARVVWKKSPRHGVQFMRGNKPRAS